MSLELVRGGALILSLSLGSSFVGNVYISSAITKTFS